MFYGVTAWMGKTYEDEKSGMVDGHAASSRSEAMRDAKSMTITPDPDPSVPLFAVVTERADEEYGDDAVIFVWDVRKRRQTTFKNLERVMSGWDRNYNAARQRMLAFSGRMR
jgi:hypothetical protein